MARSRRTGSHDHHGSIFVNGTLARTDSLLLDGTLLYMGSLLYHGTLETDGSLLGTLVKRGSLFKDVAIGRVGLTFVRLGTL